MTKKNTDSKKKNTIKNGCIEVLLFILLCILMSVPVLAETEEPNDNDQLKTVRTASLIAEREFFDVDEKTGIKSGYAYQFMTDVSAYAGWNFEYENYAWSVAFDKLVAGDIDILADVSYTEERAEKVLYSQFPMGTESYYLFTDMNSDIVSVSELEGKRIGVGLGTVEDTYLKDYLDEMDLSCEIVYYDTVADIAGMMDNKEIDAFVEISLQTKDGYNPLASIGESDFYFAINKNRPDLKEEVDSAMQKLLSSNPYYVYDLSRKYMNDAKMMRKLSDKEQAWIEENRSISVGYIDGCLPYCSTDRQGNLVGVLSDVIDTLENNYALQVNCISYNDSEVLAKELKEGKIDAAFGITDNQWIAETNQLALCPPIILSSAVMVYNNNYEKCTSGKLAISRERSFDLACFQYTIPDAEFIIYDNAEKCMEAVDNNEVDGFIGDANRVYYTVNTNSKYSRLKIANVSYESAMNFVVSKEKTELFSILNRINNFYTDAQLDDLVARWTISNSKVTLATFVINNAVAVVVGIIAISTCIIVAITTVYIRTKRLYNMSYVDALTGLNNRNAFDRDRVKLDKTPCDSIGIVFADVNGLKMVNDTYGHKAGDERIRQAAGCLEKCFGKESVYRTSGDEFVIICPNCKKADLEKTFAEFTDMVSHHYEEIISAGMSWKQGEYDMHNMISEAETGMYEMKKAHYSKYPNDRRRRNQCL